MQLLGAGAEGSSIDQLLADMDSPLESYARDDCPLKSAAVASALVKFVEKATICAYIRKVSDIHIEPMPG